MKIFNRQISLNPASDTINMESLAFLFTDLSVAPRNTRKELQIMSSNIAILQVPEFVSLRPHLKTQRVERYFIKENLSVAEKSVVADKFISITSLTFHDASDVNLLLEVSNVDRSTNIRFSIEVPLDTALADSVWMIDTGQAESLNITVIGMGFPIKCELQIVNSVLTCEFRERRDHISTGRQVCIVNRLLIL